MEIETIAGAITLPDSVRSTTAQNRSVVKNFTQPNGRKARLDINIRYDDTLKNGHNTFAMTATLYELADGYLREESGGCLHDEIARHAPELAYALPFHLVSSDGPLHYFANTTYQAGDADHTGTRKGEQRCSRKGLPMWQLPCSPFTVLYSNDRPEPYVVEYEPVLSKGKARNLAAARRCSGVAQLTDEQLMLAPDELRALLAKLNPALSETDVANTLYHAGDQDCYGCRAGEQMRNKERSALEWRLAKAPFSAAFANAKPAPVEFSYEPILGEGKARELPAARRSACWPEATDEQLSLPKAELEKLLAARLPALMAEFKKVVESFGFIY